MTEAASSNCSWVSPDVPGSPTLFPADGTRPLSSPRSAASTSGSGRVALPSGIRVPSIHNCSASLPNCALVLKYGVTFLPLCSSTQPLSVFAPSPTDCPLKNSRYSGDSSGPTFFANALVTVAESTFCQRITGSWAMTSAGGLIA